MVYLVKETATSITVSFVVAKTRVAPIQSQTIPRLELLSALLLSRLITTTAESLEPVLPLKPPRCFTDSKVALFWIQGLTKEWKPFVQNRVNEIRNSIPAEHWSHCPGKTNPADLPSRGLSPLELSVSQLWCSGPDWLKAYVNSQSEDVMSVMPEECAPELKKAQKVPTHNLLTLVDLCDLMKWKNYSSMSRLRRVTAYVLN